ncbi:MAG TPA: alcohol dehydrogenase catalytic domain-containing protein [Firmicutes bacterium]|nr:alcohol dehydrogenase catalytic domain-containing protein [Bacillota bacterium]
MLGAIFEGEGKLTLKEVDVPRVRNEDDVLLEVEMASICGTDVHILATPPGHPATPGSILGHEYVGRVIEIGKGVTSLLPGDRVVVDPNLTCGLCRYCQMGLRNMCENMTTLGIFIDGGFARYNVAPVKALYKISPNLPRDLAVFAEPLSCVINGTRKVALHPGESVVVLGAGPIGLLYTQMFKAAGAGKIIVSEVSPLRADRARASGAHLVVNPREQDLADVVKHETGIGADLVVDAVGALFGEALRLVRRGGKVLLFGMNQQAKSEIRQYDITRYEVDVMSAYISKNTFPPAIKVLESGVIDPRVLITHRISLEDISSGIEAMRNGEAIKVVITP